MEEVRVLVWTNANTEPTVSEKSIQIDFLNGNQLFVTETTDISGLSTSLQTAINALFAED